jgi:molybdopterin-guanine dinucleotide biosynthesis protein A
MGQNKSFALLNGKPMIEHILGQLALLGLPIFIVTNTPEAYARYRLPMVGDILPDHGALGGIYMALQSSSTAYVLCAACDMPFLNTALLRFLIQCCAGYEAVAAGLNGVWQVFPGVYSQACLLSKTR